MVTSHVTTTMPGIFFSALHTYSYLISRKHCTWYALASMDTNRARCTMIMIVMGEGLARSFFEASVMFYEWQKKNVYGAWASRVTIRGVTPTHSISGTSG